MSTVVVEAWNDAAPKAICPLSFRVRCSEIVRLFQEGDCCYVLRSVKTDPIMIIQYLVSMAQTAAGQQTDFESFAKIVGLDLDHHGDRKQAEE